LLTARAVVAAQVMLRADEAGTFMLLFPCNQMKRCTFTWAALQIAAAADLTVVGTLRPGAIAAVHSEAEVRPMCARVDKV
jgi:hypothetical protein